MTAVADVREPMTFTASEIRSFVELVSSGGEVSEIGLLDRVRRAEALVLLTELDELVAVGAIKRPSASYRRKVFQMAEVDAPPDQFPLELGWIVVRDGHRGVGLGNRVVEAAVAVAGLENIYATSHTQNELMHAALQRYGFARAGVPYASTMRKLSLALFLRIGSDQSTKNESGLP